MTFLQTLIKSNTNRVPAGQHEGGEFARGEGASNCNPVEIKKQLEDLGLAKHFDHYDWSMIMSKVTPREFFGAFMGADNVTKDNLSTLNKGSLDLQGISFDFRNVRVHDKVANRLERSIDFTRREAKHDMLEFNTAVSGGGIAKKMLKDCISLYSKIGVDKIHLYAGLELGAYTWGKFGFSYLDPITASNHMDQISNSTLALIKNTKSKNLQDSGVKSELKDLMTVLDAKDHNGDTPLHGNQLLSSIKTPNLDAHFYQEIARDFPKKGTFMKWIMNGSAYDGVLDMKNPNQMRSFSNYVNS